VSLRLLNLILLLSVFACALALGAAVAAPRAHAATAPLFCYRGLGTWVDMYDGHAWDDPVAAVEDMRAHGAHTLYLETSNYHWPSALNRPNAMGALIEAAHAQGMKVVAWYLPGFTDLAKDWKRTEAALDFRTVNGQSFDSFTLDIEATKVKPATLRTKRLLTLSGKIRAKVGPKYPLGACIMSPAGMTKYPSIWPGFPYAELAAIYDVFVPMGYYTYHGDGYANAYKDTSDNITIIRERSGRPTVPIHVIGGDAAKSSDEETTAYVRALREHGALGGSLYDWSTTSEGSWAILQSVRFNPRQKTALPATLPFAAPMGYCGADRTHPKEVFYQTGGQKGDRVLRFRLFDAQADEVRLLVNWKDLGPLAVGPVKKWSEVRSVTIPASALDAKKRNVVGFVARGAYPTWQRWGVREVSISAP
jgi:hypothetical protein